MRPVLFFCKQNFLLLFFEASVRKKKERKKKKNALLKFRVMATPGLKIKTARRSAEGRKELSFYVQSTMLVVRGQSQRQNSSKKGTKNNIQGQNTFLSIGNQGKTVTLTVCYQREKERGIIFNDNYSNNHETWLYRPIV